MHSPGINGEGELRGQMANPGSPGKMAVKMVCVHFYRTDAFPVAANSVRALKRFGLYADKLQYRNTIGTPEEMHKNFCRLTD